MLLAHFFYAISNLIAKLVIDSLWNKSKKNDRIPMFLWGYNVIFIYFLNNTPEKI